MRRDLSSLLTSHVRYGLARKNQKKNHFVVISRYLLRRRYPPPRVNAHCVADLRFYPFFFLLPSPGVMCLLT